MTESNEPSPTIEPAANARDALRVLDASGGARNYALLKPNDALQNLNERLASECEHFERETGLLLASIRVTRDKEDDSLKALKAHVR